MCMTVSELRAAVTELVSRFDASLVPPAEMAQFLRDAGALEKMMATLSSMVAAQMAALGPKSTSTRQAARDLAHAAGTSVPEASRALGAARSARSQPEVEAAARAGELSRQQLTMVTGAAKDNPAATQRLLEVARTGSLRELADEAARARAAGRDFEDRRKAIKASRYLRQWTDSEGAWNLRARGLPEDGAKIMAAIKPLSDAAFESARKEGRRESPEAYAYDGLVALATAGGAQAPRTEVLVRVDHPVLLRGYALDGEVCEVAGFGPVSAQAVYDILDTADPFLKAVVTKGKDVVGVTHLGRRPNAYQQTALDWLFPTCAAEGCGTRAAFLQTDHRLDWADTHVTVLDLLDRLCPLHHGLKTNLGWSLVEGRGKRAFVRPDDPRHPRHARAAATPEHTPSPRWYGPDPSTDNAPARSAPTRSAAYRPGDGGAASASTAPAARVSTTTALRLTPPIGHAQVQAGRRPPPPPRDRG